MENTLIKELFRNTPQYLDKTITVSGWVRTLRASNAFGLLN